MVNHAKVAVLIMAMVTQSITNAFRMSFLFRFLLCLFSFSILSASFPSVSFLTNLVTIQLLILYFEYQFQCPPQDVIPTFRVFALQPDNNGVFVNLAGHQFSPLFTFNNFV